MNTTIRKIGGHLCGMHAFLYLLLWMYGASLCYLKIKAFKLGLANADLSLYQNILWNTNLDGLLFYSDFLFYEYGYQSYLTEHFSPTLAILVPLYKTWSSPYLLLFIQALAPVMTAWLLYVYSRTINVPQNIAILIIIGYCIHPTVVMGTLDIGNGFHHDALIPPLLLGSLILFQRPHFLFYYCVLFLTLGLKENLPFIVLVAAIIAFVTTNAKRRAMITGGLAMAFIVVAVYIVPEIYNVKAHHALNIIERVSEQKISVNAILSTLWANNALFWFLSAFLSPFILFTIVPEMAIYHYSSYDSYIFDWHGLPSITIVVIASMIGGERWKTLTARLDSTLANRLFVIHLVAIVVVGASYSLAKSRNLIFQASVDQVPISSVNLQYFKEVEAMLPAGEKLASQYTYWPHAANRRHLLFSEHAYHAEYLFIDIELLDIENDASLIKLIIKLLIEGEIATLAHKGARFFLFKVDDGFAHDQPADFLLPINTTQFIEAKNTIAIEGVNLFRDSGAH